VIRNRVGRGGVTGGRGSTVGVDSTSSETGREVDGRNGATRRERDGMSSGLGGKARCFFVTFPESRGDGSSGPVAWWQSPLCHGGF
jgi:hypothetical protein